MYLCVTDGYEEFTEKLGISWAYIQKMLTCKTTILCSANKAFIAGGWDIQYIFPGQSDREALKKKELQIQILEDLLKKAYQGE